MAWPFNNQPSEQERPAPKANSWDAAPDCVQKRQVEFESLADCLSGVMREAVEARFNPDKKHVEIVAEASMLAEIELQTSEGSPDQLVFKSQGGKVFDTIKIFLGFEEAGRTIFGEFKLKHIAF